MGSPRTRAACHGIAKIWRNLRLSLPSLDFMPEKKKKINTLNFSPRSSYESVLWLCHSAPDVNPDGPGGGYFRPRSSFVWVKDGEHGTWKKTPFRSVERAMDAVLKAKDAATAVEWLMEGGKND